jgi:hypothetical protein
MPTVRRKIGPRRRGLITTAQRSHLECGCYFFDFDGEADHFVDEQHRYETWQAYREQILAEWCHPGKRPAAMWEYDFGLKRRPCWCCWSWPKPATTEQEMVYRLLKARRIAGCHLNGCVRIASEIDEIERNWRHEIRFTLIGHKTVPAIDGPLQTFGCPVWFFREHAPQALAEHAERAAQMAEDRCR